MECSAQVFYIGTGKARWLGLNRCSEKDESAPLAAGGSTPRPPVASQMDSGSSNRRAPALGGRSPSLLEQRAVSVGFGGQAPSAQTPEARDRHAPLVNARSGSIPRRTSD